LYKENIMPGIARLTDIFVGVCACHPPLPPIPMGGTIVTASGIQLPTV